MPDHEYEDMRRVQYTGGAQFIPVCPRCRRFVRADKTIRVNADGLVGGPNATCAKCGRVEMPFEGFLG